MAPPRSLRDRSPRGRSPGDRSPRRPHTLTPPSPIRASPPPAPAVPAPQNSRRSARLQKKGQIPKASSGNDDTRKKQPSSAHLTSKSPGKQASTGIHKMLTLTTNADQVRPKGSGQRKKTTGQDPQRDYGSKRRSQTKKKGKTVPEAVTTPTEDPIEQQRSEGVAEATKTLRADGEPSPLACDGDGEDGDGDGDEDGDEVSAIRHWAKTGEWPKNFPTMAPATQKSQKRKNTPSYSQRTKDGTVPTADTLQFDAEMERQGIYMYPVNGPPHASPASKVLIQTMKQPLEDKKTFTLLPIDKLPNIFARLAKSTEFGIFRDVTPFLVPSPGHLFLSGIEKYEHIGEDIATDWSNCQPLVGPTPRPDITVGIRPSAFTSTETAKLHTHASRLTPTIFTQRVYFPFLVCGAKGNETPIVQSERQCLRSCSIAVNAIIQLYQRLGIKEASKLSKEILVFSVSHTFDSFKIYGHFALIEESKTTFHRHLVMQVGLGYDGDHFRNGKECYDFVIKLYDHFYPKHLKRIQDALRKMGNPAPPSTASLMSLNPKPAVGGTEETETPEKAITTFKKRDIPPRRRQKRASTVDEE
ncbi:hypothetical protein AYO20_09103 [Fonsecaea nubica]|uniref:DUF7924 domain-containing protein n=1 Tax=Fonsecaea nubica TaxID=856822 RepID=A0A178CIC9_9EURO|nr:hypothetical protein AYO20_09103 [Fonsecaea nubica]OAL29719.1 hypothetical protein AYO20_09103 [Fonsecaea nubica]